MPSVSASRDLPGLTADVPWRPSSGAALTVRAR
jgi:integrase